MESLSFGPSRVEGLPVVSRVVVKPDRLELLSDGKWVTVRFANDEPEEHHASNFFLIQQVLIKGGFHTYDLG